MTDSRGQSSHHRARSFSNAARSRRLWTMRLWTFTWRRHLRGKNIKKSVIICTVTKDVDTIRLNSYTCPHSFTPLASKALFPQRCGRDYTKESSIFFQHSAARRGNGAKPEGTSLLWRHDNTANTIFSFWRRQISRWRLRWYRYTGEGGRFLPTTLLSFNVCPCTGSCCHHVHAQNYSFIMVHRPGRHSGTFSVQCMLMCVAYSND